jgi:hypothetical protein
MPIVDYKKRKVYTEYNKRDALKKLEFAEEIPAKILDFYFVERGSDSMQRAKFDLKAIRQKRQGLSISIKDEIYHSNLTLVGLDNILGFLTETQSLENISELKGKEVTKYNTCYPRGVIGISFK